MSLGGYPQTPRTLGCMGRRMSYVTEAWNTINGFYCPCFYPFAALLLGRRS